MKNGIILLLMWWLSFQIQHNQESIGVKSRDSQLSPIWRQLKMIAPDGKNRLTDCAITKHTLIKNYTRKVTFFGEPPFSLVNAPLFQDSLDLEDYQDIAIQRLIIMEVFLPKLVNYNRTANSED